MHLLNLTTFALLLSTVSFPKLTLGQYYSEEDSLENPTGPYYYPSLPTSEEYEDEPLYNDEIIEDEPVVTFNKVRTGRVRLGGWGQPRNPTGYLSGGWRGWESPGIRYTGSLRPHYHSFQGAYHEASQFFSKAVRGWYANNNAINY